ncbi:hypothetical protein GP486_003464, partial [Trichoglossum hirsutum]
MQVGPRPAERLIRLAPRSIKDKVIPWHPAFSGIVDGSNVRPAVDQFLEVAIRQAVHFSSRILPRDVLQDPETSKSKSQGQGWKFKEVREVDGNDVLIYRRKVRPDLFRVPDTGTESGASDAPLPPVNSKAATEYWFARDSTHFNVAEDGTATYEEFFRGLKENHSENEKEFTPNIKWAKKLLEWEGAPNVGFRGRTWTDAHMSIYEVYHSLPTGINDRIFPFLLIHAKINTAEFIVISIPLTDTHLLSESNIPSRASGGRSAVIAKYVAVERVRVLPRAEKKGQEPAATSDDDDDAKSKVE